MLREKYGMLVDQALRDFKVDAFYAATIIEKAKAILARREKREETE